MVWDTGVCVSYQHLADCSMLAHKLASRVKPHTFWSWKEVARGGAVFIVQDDSCPRGLET